MQTEINNKIWEDKDIRSARMSSIKASVNLLDIAERIGLLKSIHSLEDLFTEFNGIRNQIFDMIYKDMPMHTTTTHTETYTETYTDDGLIVEPEPSDKQRQYIEDLGGDPWKPKTKKEASEYIKELQQQKQQKNI